MTTEVADLPPNDDLRSIVNTESRYEMCRTPSPSSLMTFPSDVRDELMPTASAARSPVTPVLAMRWVNEVTLLR